MTKQLITTFLFLLVGVYVFGQKDTSVSRMATECFETTIYNDDYFINLNGVNYRDNDKAYICAPGEGSIIPIDIILKTTGQSVISSNWDWSDCDCTPSTPSSSTANITLSDFGNENLTIKVSFDDVDLKLKVYKIEKLEYDEKKTIANAAYSYDENKIKQFPFFEINAIDKNTDGVIDKKETLPFLYTNSNEESSIYFKGHKNVLKGVELEQDQIVTDAEGNIISSTESDDIIVNILENKATLSLSSISNDSRYLLKSCTDENILNLDTYLPRTLYVDLYSLSESDDDIPNYCVNFGGTSGATRRDLMPDCNTPINSLPHIEAINYVCILPGEDRTLDLYANPDLWVSPLDNTMLVDPELDHTLQIVAGENKKCNSTPLPHNTHNFINSQDVAKISLDLNTIYNKIGINIIITNHGQIEMNYDSFNEDNILDNTRLQGFMRLEFVHFSSAIKELNYFENKNTILIAPKMIEYGPTLQDLVLTKGSATGFDSNVVVLNDEDMQDRTPAHECGHAFFGLHHPDNDPAGDNISGNGLDCKFGGCDKTNLMNSGPVYKKFKSDVKLEDFILRKYQWDKIFRNL